MVSIPRAPIKGNQFTLANVNSRPVHNKVSPFVDYVITAKLDICFVTDTWLNDKDSIVRNEIGPDGYVSNDHQGRIQVVAPVSRATVRLPDFDFLEMETHVHFPSLRS